jgi:predicted phage tail protein
MADSAKVPTGMTHDLTEGTAMPQDISPVSGEAHPFQPWRFVVGALVLAVALLVLVNEGGVIDVNGQVAGAVLLVIAGAALVVRSVLKVMRRT